MKEKIQARDFGSFCMKAEGSGRFKAWGENYQFNYSTDIEDDQWLMGLRFPLHGEEILKFNLKGTPKFEGDFYHRINDAYFNFQKSDKTYSQADFNKFLTAIGTVIKFIVTKDNVLESCKQDEKINDCEFERSKMTFKISKNQFGYHLIHQINQQVEIFIQIQELEGGIYKKYRIFLRQKDQLFQKVEINLDLLHSDCITS